MSALEVIFLASHISLQSTLSLEMGYLMFNTSSYSTTLIYTVIYSQLPYLKALTCGDLCTQLDSNPI